MADFNDTNNSGNTEMEIETNVLPLDLSDFVTACVFPQAVCVAEGNFLSRDVQINPGDVLVLKSCNKGQVVLSYKDEDNHKWTEVSVSLDYAQKFNVLPPKDTSAENRTSSVFMYPTISDLILDCPTYFEATASYDDPYLPEMSVKTGDQFWFVGMAQYPESGVERLKVRDEKGKFRFLSLDCKGNFSHLKDDNEYTIKELVELAAVQRRLKMVIKQQNLKETMHFIENEHSKDQYAVVNKTASKSSQSFSSAVTQSSQSCLPDSFSGIIHLLKYESTVAVSPYDDLETTWVIPLSASLKVRSYSQNDYEVPAPRKPITRERILLPLSPNDDVPKFQAPIVPQHPLVPLNISNFVDIYCSTLPVKAMVADTSEAHPFFQDMMKGIDEVNIYRLDEAKRLYVKDAKSDNVYSLSHDLTLSFVEYPEKFTTISDLLHLPVGTEVTVLEDIAADFPKPFSLRLGDIIRVLSNTPYFVKMKHAHRNCQVLKCERCDPDGGDNTKLKIPMDFEVSMVKTTDSNSRRMVSLQDLLSGTVPLPTQIVASVLNAPENTDLKDLPVDLRILKSMKDTCVVAASATSKQFPPRLVPKASNVPKSDSSPKEKAALSNSPNEPALLTNIGLPITSGIILAFKDRLELAELDVAESEADYIRLPLEKLTLSQFEERERLRKLNSDYEDIEFGSNSTIDECGDGAGSMSRSGSLGVIDRKQKSTKMDKVLRFSRALNPKHWRHSKAEPEPLPHPSAMGLMALAAREKDDISNDYHQTRMDSTSSNSESVKDGFAASSISPASSDEEENFYEDVEIGPIKASTIDTPSARQTGAFSGPTHRSLPPRMPSRLPARPPSRHSDFSRGTTHTTGHSTTAPDEESTVAGIETDVSETHIYDVPSPFIKAKNWASNIGNTIGDRFSTKPRFDIPKNSKAETSQAENEKTPVTKRHSTLAIDRRPPEMKPPMPPIFPTDSNPPVPPSRRKRGKTTPQNSDSNTDQNGKKEQNLVTSVSLDDSLSSASDGAPAPRPKPRGQKKPESLEAPSPETRTSVNISDIVKGVETFSMGKHTSTVSPSCVPAKDNLRPKPPPKPKASTQTTV